MPTKKKSGSPAIHSKAKRYASTPIQLASVFLELKSMVMPTWNNEPGDYITPLTGNVCLQSDDDDGHTVVGSISAYAVHLGNASDNGVAWFDVLDFYNADIALYLDLFETDASSYTDWVQSNQHTNILQRPLDFGSHPSRTTISRQRLWLIRCPTHDPKLRPTWRARRLRPGPLRAPAETWTGLGRRRDQSQSRGASARVAACPNETASIVESAWL
jgi:hypothetical protein